MNESAQATPRHLQEEGGGRSKREQLANPPSKALSKKERSFAVFQQALKKQNKLKSMKQHIENAMSTLRKVVKRNIKLRRLTNKTDSSQG